VASVGEKGYAGSGEMKMTQPDLRVEVQDPYILVAMRGTCLRAKYRKQDASWLAPEEYGEDPEATITFSEFRTLAWEVANEAARQLGWNRTCDELHEAAKRAGIVI
jgi:hypothetical protein